MRRQPTGPGALTLLGLDVSVKRITRTRLRGEDRRRQLLDVTAGIVAKYGVGAVTMESVANAGGVSKGLSYAYFANRGQLLLALLDRELADLMSRVGGAMAEGMGFEDRVRGGIEVWFRFLSERGRMMDNLLRAAQVQVPMQARRNEQFRALEEQYGQMATEEFGIGLAEARVAASVFLAGLDGLLERWRYADDDPGMLQGIFVELVMGGMREMAAARSSELGVRIRGSD